MPHPPPSAMRLATALLALIALALVVQVGGSQRVLAAEPLSIEVRPLLAGRFASGGWLAIDVRLANQGSPLEGFATVTGEDGSVRRPVELPAGSQKSVVLYVRPPAFSRQLEVRLEDRDGRTLATGSGQVRVLAQGSGQTLIVGDGGGALRAQLVARRQQGLAEPVTVPASDLPERPEPLHGFRTLVWAADSTGLSQGQRRALERWLASGGHLIVVGGADWQARTAAFAAQLPVGPLMASEGANATELRSLVGDLEAGGPGDTLEGLTAASGELIDGAVRMASLGDGRPLLAAVARGAGRVTYVAVDLGAAPLSGWEGAPLLWSRVVGGAGWAEQLGGFPIEQEADGLMANALGQLPALDVPPAELLLAVIVAYILLIGPVSYVALRRLDRRELAWITAPVLVVVFSAGTYGIGSALKGSDVILHELSIVRTASGASAASVQTYAGIFSPTRARYDLAVHADALVAGVNTSGFGVPTSARRYTIEQGDPSRLRGLEINIFGLEAIRADSVVAHQPALDVTWTTVEGEITGSVINTGQEPMEDVAVITLNGGVMVGELAPNERKEFRLRLSAGGGRSPADSVYGFSGFNVRNDEQRRTMIRRSVIESIAGYGGWMAFPAEGGVDRGPFVIGWRVSPGPVALEVEGQQVRRYAQTVEVLSGRPGIGAGKVTLQPLQLATSLVETDGDVWADDPSYIEVGNGSATFRISLPLEAIALDPSALTVVAGSDPSMVVFDRGNAAGFFPPGYELAAYNHATEEWVTLGELDARTRFAVDDPRAYLDASGQILARVSGSAEAPNFGPVAVFVSAEVEGRLDR